MIESYYMSLMTKKIVNCCRKYRKMNKDSQKQIAVLYGVSHESVSAFECCRIFNIKYLLMYTELYPECAEEISGIFWKRRM